MRFLNPTTERDGRGRGFDRSLRSPQERSRRDANASPARVPCPSEGTRVSNEESSGRRVDGADSDGLRPETSPAPGGHPLLRGDTPRRAGGVPPGIRAPNFSLNGPEPVVSKGDTTAGIPRITKDAPGGVSPAEDSRSGNGVLEGGHYGIRKRCPPAPCRRPCDRGQGVALAADRVPGPAPAVPLRGTRPARRARGRRGGTGRRRSRRLSPDHESTDRSAG